MKLIPTVDIKVQVELDYQEAKALDAMAAYGADSFLKVFKEQLGGAYIKPYEEGIRSLFQKITATDRPIQSAIRIVEKAKKEIENL